MVSDRILCFYLARQIYKNPRDPFCFISLVTTIATIEYRETYFYSKSCKDNLDVER